MKKRILPENIEYADMDRIENRKKYTKEYIEQRIRNQKPLTKVEENNLSNELKLYYAKLDAEIKKLKKN